MSLVIVGNELGDCYRARTDEILDEFIGSYVQIAMNRCNVSIQIYSSVCSLKCDETGCMVSIVGLSEGEIVGNTDVPLLV